MVQPGQNEIKCPYCGSGVIVPPELRIKVTPPPAAAPTPSYPSFPTYNTPQIDEQISGQISTVGKVAAGIAITSMIAPIAITLVVFCIVGVFLAFLFWGINSSIQSATSQFPDTHALQTSIVETVAPIPTIAPPATEAPTETPTVTPVPIAVSTPFSKVLFHDDFVTKKGWEVYKDTDYTLGYVKGGYRIYINGNGGQTTWIGGLDYKDVNVVADVQYVDGPQDGVMSVSCRLKRSSGFYSFEFSPSGAYAIKRYTVSGDNSDAFTLAEGTMDASGFTNSTVYHLRGDCIGTTLTMYLDDQPLLQVQDSKYASGSIGIGAALGSSGDLGVDTLFSNYVVTGK